MDMQDRPEDKLLQKLNGCPLFSGSLGPSLRQRINAPHWFENRFIQAILRDTGWIEEHERLLVEADIGEVKNSDKIFGDLDGGDLDYDLKIFDVLAEVRLIRWARENGYTNIEKLIPGGKPTPDYLMRKDAKITIAEAKRFRERDFLPEFVEDRLKGLVLKTGCLTEFGVMVDTTDKYARERENLLRTRLEDEHRYRDAVREELTEEWLEALEDSLSDDPGEEPEIVNGLLVVRRVEIPHEASVGLFGLYKNQRAAELMLEKLCGNLMTALKQIKSFIEGNLAGGIPSRALVFLSGTSSWSMEWDDMWRALRRYGDSTICEKVKEIHCEASELIKLPFELIVAKHREELTELGSQTTMTLEYAPFPWPRDR
jgi:hypothetical protein